MDSIFSKFILSLKKMDFFHGMYNIFLINQPKTNIPISNQYKNNQYQNNQYQNKPIPYQPIPNKKLLTGTFPSNEELFD
jgi:hypothetical protein